VSLRCIRSFCSSVNTRERATSNRRVTFEFTLFTFCPPGPALRDTVNLNSFRSSLTKSANGVVMPGVLKMIRSFFEDDRLNPRHFVFRFLERIFLQAGRNHFRPDEKVI